VDLLEEVTGSLREASGEILVLQVAPPQDTDETVDLVLGSGWERGGSLAKMTRAAGSAPGVATAPHIERVDGDRAADFRRVLIEGMEMPPIMNGWAARQTTGANYAGYGASRRRPGHRRDGLRDA
jgi:hypothetical protein